MTLCAAGGQAVLPSAAGNVLARRASRERAALAGSVLLAWAAWLAPAARADVVEVGAAADATLYAEDGTLANGGGQYLFAGRNAMSEERRALITFDVAAAVPAGSSVTAVQLSLSMSRAMTAETTVSLHRVQAGWGEAGSHAAAEEGGGAPAQAGDATWSHRLYGSAAWTTPGGDFAPDALASAVVGAPGTYSWSGAALAADVQAFLDSPAGNFGWLLLGEGAGTAKRFDSRQHATASARPKLIVTFTPPSTTGACCGAAGGCTLVLHTDSATECASGSYQGLASVCAPNPCPQPRGACCLPDAGGTCMELDEAACAAGGGDFGGTISRCSEAVCPAVLEPFVDALPILPVAQPIDGTSGGRAEYALAMSELAVKLHRDLPPTTVWGIDDGRGARFPGPTIEAFEHEPVTVSWRNDLRELGSGVLRARHPLPVDQCVHGAAAGPPRTVIHLHGGHVPARYDGFPEDAYPPGESARYVYPNRQPAATLWYHDHAIGVTRLNVYMGLAGMYVLRDPRAGALALPSGSHEVALVIQDRSLRGDGSLIYPEMLGEHFFGNSMLVNGKVWPYLDVDRGKYRFRVLNACNARTLTLTLDDGASFQVIATDGGLLPAPVTVSSLTLSAGERAELVVDFASYTPGTQRILRNSAPAPHPGSAGVGVVADVMKFVVGGGTGFTAALPQRLAGVEPIDEDASVGSRDFVLQSQPAQQASACPHRAWLINGLRWHDVREYPRLGTTEIWRFVNPSGVSHPMHMHLVQFQILDRQPIELVDGVVSVLGPALPPAAEEAGWKDTVLVRPAEAVRVIATFTDYTGAFAYHCHILEHEDHEMMRQFVTTTVCGDGVVGEPAEECDDGGESATCDDDCTRAACGDGVVNARAGELCDERLADGDPAACGGPCPAASDGGARDAGADGGVSDGGADVADGGSDAGDRAERDAAAAIDAGRVPDGGARADADKNDGEAGGAPDAGCSCRIGANAPASRLGVLGTLLALGLITRRRRARAAKRGSRRTHELVAHAARERARPGDLELEEQ